MRLHTDKFRLLGGLCVILVTGFLATSIASYLASRDAIREGISEQSLPLTSDNVYSEIQKDLLRPVLISSLMANDALLRDWMLAGEADRRPIFRYLEEVRFKYGTVTSFLASERSRTYYHASGATRTLHESDPREQWYFRLARLPGSHYEVNVDPDFENRGALTIFINHRVLDYEGRLLGITGVGLTFDTVRELIESYQQRFMRRIYFVDTSGKIVLAGQSMRHIRGSLSSVPGIREVADDLLKKDVQQTHLRYHLDGQLMLVNSRFIPELGWHLVVEQSDAEEVKAVQRVFMVNLMVSGVVTLLVLLLTLVAANHFQRRLELQATTDPLTGTLNRLAFDLSFEQAMLESKRSLRPMSVILLDLDNFKKINDKFGHLAGDAVLQSVTEIIRTTMRRNDVLARWGGEEFIILLKECTASQAGGAAEKLRAAIQRASLRFGTCDIKVTASIGVAERGIEETGKNCLTRVDRAMYVAKRKGRNRVVTAPLKSARTEEDGTELQIG